MPITLAALAVDSPDPRRVARFWAELLGREVVTRAEGVELPGSVTQPTLRFIPGDAAAGPDRMHLHLTSETPEHQQAQVWRALDLGGRHLDDGQLPEEGHIVLADPDGNAFCVIEAGNRYLAGCGPLGEFACDGRRVTGEFWSVVLGWPLVWDDGEETAIQHPDGGTKIAWGGPPLGPKPPRNRHRLVLASDDPVRDFERLSALGARLLDAGAGLGALLADPDENEFHLVAAD